MKKYIIIPAIIFMVTLRAFSQDTEWLKYTTAEGHYSMSFPGKPEESSQDSKSADSVPFKIHFVTYAPSDDVVYMSGWIDMTTFYPKDVSMKQMLENSRDGATSSMKATFVSTVDTSLGKEPYIEFTFKTDEYTGKARIYIIDKFQYSLITIFSLKTGILTTADKFIKSFKHSKT